MKIYGDENKSEIISNTAPILKLKFGSGIEKIAKFGGVNGNKITYTYQIESGDKGELKTTNYSGNVYDEAGNILTVVNQNIGGNRCNKIRLIQWFRDSRSVKWNNRRWQKRKWEYK